MPKKRVGVTRETADRLLDNLRTRAKEIDADPQYLYGISRLAVFGSYLTAKDKWVFRSM
jgi:predicted nucleotidyltransferase